MKSLNFTTSIQHLQIATQPSAVVALPVQRDPKALLQQATAEAAAKFDRIKAVFQKVDAPEISSGRPKSLGAVQNEPQPGQHAWGELIRNLGDGLPLSQVGIDLPELDPEGKASQRIEADNIRARQPLYLGEMLEETRAPKVADRLGELFQNGFLSIATQGSGSIPKRNSFFTGRLLAENDLQAEQQYRRNELVVSADQL